jgi:hypothetical protein
VFGLRDCHLETWKLKHSQQSKIKLLDSGILWKWNVLQTFRRNTLLPSWGTKCVRYKYSYYNIHIYIYLFISNAVHIYPCPVSSGLEWGKHSCLYMTWLYYHSTHFAAEDGDKMFLWNFSSTAHFYTVPARESRIYTKGNRSERLKHRRRVRREVTAKLPRTCSLLSDDTLLSCGEERNVRFQVLTAANMMFRIVFWDVLPCKIIVDRRFRGTYCLHHQGWRKKWISIAKTSTYHTIFTITWFLVWKYI